MKLLSEYDKSAVAQAQLALGKLLNFHNREIFSPSDVPPKPRPPKGLLFHYATAEGFKGIIEKNEFWATSAYSQKDTNEIMYGRGLLKDALDEWIADNSLHQDWVSLKLAQDFKRSFGEERAKVVMAVPIYIGCFCEDDDSPSHWNNYGHSGGCSIGFRVPSDIFTPQGFVPEPNTFTSKWVKVDYDRNGQAIKCRSILNKLLPFFDGPDTAKAVETIGSHPLFGYSVIRRALADILLEEIVGFKSPEFEDEKEWRIVVRKREWTKQGTDDGGKTPLIIHSRSLKGAQVSYIKIIPATPTGKLPVASVRIGPPSDNAKACVMARDFLDKNGFTKVRVEGYDRETLSTR